MPLTMINGLSHVINGTNTINAINVIIVNDKEFRHM